MKNNLFVYFTVFPLLCFSIVFSSLVYAGQSDGIKLASQGMFKEARIEFSKALEINREDSLSKGALGILDDFDSGRIKKECLLSLFKGLGLLTVNLPEQAIDEFKLAEKAAPGYPQTHNILGMAYTILGSFKEAEIQFKEAIELQPEYSQAYFNLGTFYQSQGKNTQALEYYEKALRLDQNSADTYMNIGYIYAGEGRYDKAISYFQKVSSLDPQRADAYYSLGMAYFMSDQYLKSRENFIKAKDVFQQKGDQEGVSNTDKYLDKFFELEGKWKAKK